MAAHRTLWDRWHDAKVSYRDFKCLHPVAHFLMFYVGIPAAVIAGSYFAYNSYPAQSYLAGRKADHIVEAFGAIENCIEYGNLDKADDLAEKVMAELRDSTDPRLVVLYNSALKYDAAIDKAMEEEGKKGGKRSF